ncbi:methyltransferase [Streptomyces sp. 150FB]|uniref:SAM-dependent methyltransferase n=1 Tax=Streptomyces sp. 150FB TaxID=1576605 RepID=UPI000589675C|nr:SAM-dependent methyltransferase [Streptomyces sp. 150FB]KIF75726.1 methyltransferase [Streptomyces sp. 150FB]
MTAETFTPTEHSESPLNTGKPHPARVYDFLIGGRDNYLVDQRVGEALPEIAKRSAVQNRAFMHRAVEWLARQGIDQYLDIGTGIPTEPNLHQIAQLADPASRIVYADNDPVVLRHAVARLISSPEGATKYVQADVRDPLAILQRAGELLDFGRPVALSLIALLHFLPDTDDPWGITRTLVDALPAGSFLVLSHSTADFHRRLEGPVLNAYGDGGITVRPRSREEVERFFEGLDLVEPGLVTAPKWYRDTAPPEDEDCALYAGVARVG